MNFRKYLFIVSTVLFAFMILGGSTILAIIKFPTIAENLNLGSINKFTEPLKMDNEPFNVLLLGGDYVGANTDTIMLVNYNPSTAKLNVLSIPRDTKVEVKGSSIPKINSAYAAGGATYTVDLVSKLLNVKIKYHVFINTTAFKEIVNLLDGVDYNVPVNMDYDDPTQDLHIHLKKGPQKFDGIKAEQYMRFRQPNTYTEEILKFYDGSDLKRIEAQQSFLKEIVRQKANVKYVSKADDIIKASLKYVDTNITMNDTVNILNNATQIKYNEMSFFRVPGDAVEGGLSFYVIDKSKTTQIINQYFSTKPVLQEKKK